MINVDKKFFVAVTRINFFSIVCNIGWWHIVVLQQAIFFLVCNNIYPKMGGTSFVTTSKIVF